MQIPANDVTTNHIIANVSTDNPIIPTISIKMADENIQCLMDTGSSISLMLESFFESIKPKLKDKILEDQYQYQQ